jgi:SAM-dependent methyltransferase
VDRWNFFDVTHRDHQICNPLSSAKLGEMIELLDLPAGARVLDIACGKAEPLVRLVERYGASAVGVDLSPPFVADARRRVAERVPGADVTITEMDGSAYAASPETFDLAMCLGASWVFGGYRGTLRALAAFVRPGGLVLSGEPFWRRQPDADYLAAAGLTRELFATHAGNVGIGTEEGLTPLYALVSSEDDFDRYEALQWRAAERYARAHPDDPDTPELLTRQRRERETYLRWGRDTLGWALYLFLK